MPTAFGWWVVQDGQGLPDAPLPDLGGDRPLPLHDQPMQRRQVGRSQRRQHLSKLRCLGKRLRVRFGCRGAADHLSDVAQQFLVSAEPLAADVQVPPLPMQPRFLSPVARNGRQQLQGHGRSGLQRPLATCQVGGVADLEGWTTTGRVKEAKVCCQAGGILMVRLRMRPAKLDARSEH